MLRLVSTPSGREHKSFLSHLNFHKLFFLLLRHRRLNLPEGLVRQKKVGDGGGRYKKKLGYKGRNELEKFELRRRGKMDSCKTMFFPERKRREEIEKFR